MQCRNETTSKLCMFQVWCIDGSAKTALPKEELGKFYSGDCYVVLYTYHSAEKKEEFYLAYWIGKNSVQVIVLQIYTCLRCSALNFLALHLPSTPVIGMPFYY
jgi:hypothetical protein